MTLTEVLSSLRPADTASRDAAQKKVDGKTMPRGALGLISECAVRLSAIQRSTLPEISGKQMIVFAADHGITKEGVSAYPAEVTPQMVMNFLSGGAAINVFCRHYGIGISVADVGVNYDFQDVPGLIHKKIAPGTRNFRAENAMTRTEAEASVLAGMETVFELHGKKSFNVLGLGEMGIGNTSAASAAIASILKLDAEQVCGRGTGLDDEGLKRKVNTLREALKARKPDASDGLDVLSKVGGFEIGAIAGAAIAAASLGCAVVLDGLISTSGGLIASLLCPTVKDYLFSGHRSVEIGQHAALKALGLSPLVDLNFRLGEGTGAAIAIDHLALSCKMMREMASFEEAGVSQKD